MAIWSALCVNNYCTVTDWQTLFVQGHAGSCMDRIQTSGYEMQCPYVFRRRFEITAHGPWFWFVAKAQCWLWQCKRSQINLQWREWTIVQVNMRGDVMLETLHLGASCCCNGRAIGITYPECVFIALGFQHAKRMRRIAICDLSGSTTFFHNISFHNFRKESCWT